MKSLTKVKESFKLYKMRVNVVYLYLLVPIEWDNIYGTE